MPRTMELPESLRCHAHQAPFVADDHSRAVTPNTRSLTCPHGCTTPVARGIPRFVGSENYAAAFGRQWNVFRKTQLDSFIGLPISQERLTRCLGASLDVVKDKSVLEAGCGAGRFTEQLLAAGARVFACDLSDAVDANYENCRRDANYFVCQADLRALPVQPGQFDVVVCLGVIQHTPEPERTIARLATYLKPGGLLVIDHYRYGVEDLTVVRRRLRAVLLRLGPPWSLWIVRAIVAALWPIHRLLWRGRGRPWIARGRQAWMKWSPVLDYHDEYGQLGPRLLYAWAALDTHDALTDVYKHKRTVRAITDALRAAGLEGIEAGYGGNGVEARAVKPAAGGASRKGV